MVVTHIRGKSRVLKECIIKWVKNVDYQIWEKSQISEAKIAILDLFPGNIYFFQVIYIFPGNIYFFQVIYIFPGNIYFFQVIYSR